MTTTLPPLSLRTTGYRRPAGRLFCFGAVACAMASMLMLGCGEDRGTHSQRLQLVDRWAEPDSEAIALASLRNQELIVDWRFRAPSDLTAWTLVRVDSHVQMDTGLKLQSQTGHASLLRHVGFGAEQVDRLELRLQRGPNQIANLYWTSEGEDFSEEKSLRTVAENRGRSGASLAVFRLAQHPRWEGKIDRLRIDLKAEGELESVVLGIRGIRTGWNQRELERHHGATMEIDREGEVRRSLLGAPGQSIDRVVEAGRSSRLRVGYAVPEGSKGLVEASIVARTRDGEEKTLFRERLGPTSSGWADLDLELAGLNSGPLNVSLVASGVPGSSTDVPPVFWSSPLVVADPGGGSRPNIVLVVIDTLRKDRMSLYGHERTTTARLDAWAQNQAVVFENAIAPAPWTLPSHVSLFSGLPSLEHGVNYSGRVPDRLHLLPEHLTDAGYFTAAVTGGAFLNPFFGLTQGFDRYRYRSPTPGRELADVGKDWKETLDTALTWLDELPAPYFLFVHTYEVHAPYKTWEPWYEDYAAETEIIIDEPIEDFLTRPESPVPDDGWQARASFTERTRVPGLGLRAQPMPLEHLPLLEAAYDSGVAHTDQGLGDLLGKIDELEATEDLLVILTSDHGESLGERSTAGHSYLWEFNLQIPLIVALPNRRFAGKRVVEPAQLVDVLPTVLEVAERSPPGNLVGSSLLGLAGRERQAAPRTIESYAASTNFGMAVRIGNRWKFHFQNAAWDPIRGQGALYDLNETPTEWFNRTDSMPVQTRELEALLRDRFLSSASYLQVDVVNPSDLSVKALLTGDLVRPTRVRAFDVADGVLRWSDGLEVLLGPRQEVTILLEGLSSGEISVDTVATDSLEVSVVGAIQLALAEEDSAALQLDLKADGWSRVDSLEQDSVGLTFRWQGPRSAEVPEAQIDDGLSEQLRSLGYVD